MGSSSLIKDIMTILNLIRNWEMFIQKCHNNITIDVEIKMTMTSLMKMPRIWQNFIMAALSLVEKYPGQK